MSNLHYSISILANHVYTTEHVIYLDPIGGVVYPVPLLAARPDTDEAFVCRVPGDAIPAHVEELVDEIEDQLSAVLGCFHEGKWHGEEVEALQLQPFAPAFETYIDPADFFSDVDDRHFCRLLREGLPPETIIMEDWGTIGEGLVNREHAIEYVKGLA